MIIILIINGKPLRYHVSFFLRLIVGVLITLAVANILGALLSLLIVIPGFWPADERSWNIVLGLALLLALYLVYKILGPIYFRRLETKLFDSPAVVFPRTAEEFRAYGVKSPLDFCWLALVLETAPVKIGGLKLAVYPCNTEESAKYFEKIFIEMFGRMPAADTWYQAIAQECAKMQSVDPRRITDMLVLKSLSPSIFDNISPDFAFNISLSELC